MKLITSEFQCLASCLEGFFFGLYSGIFVMNLQYHLSKKHEGVDNAKRNIIFYALCVLYVLSAVSIALDIASELIVLNIQVASVSHDLSACTIAVTACCDFITQFILIHRCWIVWDCNIRVVIIPSILALAFLGIWMAGIGSMFIAPSGLLAETLLGVVLGLTSLTISMTVNAWVTGLIVFRIFRVFRSVKSINTSNQTSSHLVGGRKLRSIIFVLIESGMALFAIQVTRLVTTIIALFTDTQTLSGALVIIIGIHEMLNGITPTIIRVRISMGFSFHDEPSLVEAVGSLQFAAVDSDSETTRSSTMQIESDDPIPVPNIITQKKRDNDIGYESDDTQMVDNRISY